MDDEDEEIPIGIVDEHEVSPSIFAIISLDPVEDLSEENGGEDEEDGGEDPDDPGPLTLTRLFAPWVYQEEYASCRQEYQGHKCP